MPGPMMNPPGQAMSVGNGTAGGMVQGGYGAAMGSLNNALQANNNTTSSQMGQLGRQLQQNQGNVQQMMTNRGLGNTTVAGTMSQVPLQTYNMGTAQVQNQQQMRAMQLYSQMGNLQAAGGQAAAAIQNPYDQTRATTAMMQSMKPGPQSDFNAANAQNQMASQYQNLMNAQQPTSYGLNFANSQQQAAPAQAQQAANPFQGMDPNALAMIGAQGGGSGGDSSGGM